jgi:uncharacterized delta-60 repeat protein
MHPRSRVAKRGRVRASRSIRRLWLALLVVGVGLTLVLPADAARRAGQLDRSFSSDGVAFTGFGPGGTGRSYQGSQVAAKASRKVVIAGATRGSNTNAIDFGVAQFRSNGKLDPSFGNQGTTRIDFGGFDTVTGLAVDQHSRTILTGPTGESTTELGIARLLPGGTPDPSFGPGGKQVVDLNGPSTQEVEPFAMAPLPGGKMIVGGEFGLRGAGFVARLRSNGTPDASFGSHGVKKVLLPDVHGTEVTDVALDRHGRIVVSANSFGPQGRIGVIRLTRSGHYDSSFSGDGRKRFLGRRIAQLFGVATTPTGATVVVGNALRHRRHARPLVARLDAVGRLDKSFGGDGVVITTLHTKHLNNGWGWAELLQGKGRVVIACELRTRHRHHAATFARLTRHGRIDRSFGRHGKSIAPGVDGLFGSMARQSNGKILAGGQTLFNAAKHADKAVVARLLP